jgi:hypothetical protein
MPLLEYQTADGGYLGIELDVVERESYESTAETIEHAVDSGVVLSDHVKRNPDTITLEGMVTNTPIVLPRTQMGGVTASVQASTLSVGGRELRASVLTFSGPFDRVRAVDDALHALMGGVVVRYTGTLRTTDDMIVTRYRVDRDAQTGGALPVTIELRKIRRAEVRRVPVPAQRRGQPPAPRGAEPAPPRASVLANLRRWAGGL